MHNPTPTGSNASVSGDLSRSPMGLGDRSDARPAIISLSAMTRRRLRYFIDLMVAGYHHALNPEPLIPSLRSERIALGIDLPELDTVPLWSTHRSDGAVSIPFIEFILGQIDQNLDEIGCDQEAANSVEVRNLQRARRAIARVLKDISPKGDPAPAYPRLRDLYVPAPILEELCGPEGLGEQVLQRCAALAQRAAGDLGH
jgi:hypothetical protein